MRVKTKVFLGYVVLVVISALIVWIFYSEYLKKGAKVEADPVNEKVMLFSSILTNLYQSESLGRNYAQTGIAEHYNNYSILIDSIHKQILQLEIMLNDSVQKVHIERFINLIDEKKTNLEELALIKNNNTAEDIYNEAISKIKAIPKITVPSNSEAVVDTIYIKSKKKKFIKRIVSAFSKQNVDSTFHIIEKQTVNDKNKTDSLANYFAEIINDIKKGNTSLENYLKEKEQEVIENDLIITSQLRHILTSIEQNDLMNSYSEIEEQKSDVRKATIYIVILGSLALISVIFFLINILKDITKSQHYRQNLEKANAFTEFLLHSKEQFMYSLTHDLKSPVNSIIGFSGLLEENSSKEQLNYIDNIRKSSEHILKLINDLLDLARLDSGKIKIDHIPVDLKILINDTIENFRPQSSAKGLELIDNFQIEGNAWYLSDPLRITQILSNLISNAIKFTEKGSVTINVLIAETQPNTDIIRIDITDTGIGITNKDLSLLFKEFGRLETTKSQEGTGLGLVITQKLASMLKGTVDVKSEHSTGSCFSVQLPLEKTSIEPEQDKLLLVGKTTDVLVGKTAWLVDDDIIFREMIINILKPTGLTIAAFDNPFNVIEEFESGCTDFLISDIRMPGMDGFELVKRIFEKNNEEKNLVTILMSGQAEIPDKPDNVIFVQKPFQPLQLISIMVDAVN